MVSFHPLVQESAVVGCPDETLGEMTVCFVVQKPNVLKMKFRGSVSAAASDIKSLCALKLSQSKVSLFFKKP